MLEFPDMYNMQQEYICLFLFLLEYKYEVGPG